LNLSKSISLFCWQHCLFLFSLLDVSLWGQFTYIGINGTARVLVAPGIPNTKKTLTTSKVWSPKAVFYPTSQFVLSFPIYILVELRPEIFTENLFCWTKCKTKDGSAFVQEQRQIRCQRTHDSDDIFSMTMASPFVVRINMDIITQIRVVRQKKEEVLPVFMKSREMFYFFHDKRGCHSLRTNVKCSFCVSWSKMKMDNLIELETNLNRKTCSVSSFTKLEQY
jgi:hypothetical protein